METTACGRQLTFWKIDQQQDLERSDVAEWFPAQPAEPKAGKSGGAASSAPQTP